MTCEICSLDSTVESPLWKCIGCTRVFHITCVGITVQRNSLRRRDKKIVDVSSYILPCCETCQDLLQTKLEVNRLTEQQKNLANQLHTNSEVLHCFALQQESPNIVHEAIESLEVQLTSIKNELTSIHKNNSIVAIRNHMTSLFDTAMMASKENVSMSLKTIATDMSTELRNINTELANLNQLSLDIASNCTMHSNPSLELEILDELKSLSANIIPTQSLSPSPLPSDSCPSLEVELQDQQVSGWRFLGTKKVWKADWSEYDARKLHRLKQQKRADKAKKQSKQHNSRLNAIINKSHNHRNINNQHNYQIYHQTTTSFAQWRYRNQ